MSMKSAQITQLLSLTLFNIRLPERLGEKADLRRCRVVMAVIKPADFHRKPLNFMGVYGDSMRFNGN